MSAVLDRLCARMGILPSFYGHGGQETHTSPDTARALLGAMGLAATTEAEAADTLARLEAEDAARVLPPWQVEEPGREIAVTGLDGRDWSVTLEDGQMLSGHGNPVPPLPLGIHGLTAGGSDCALLCAPVSLPLPPMGWGVTMPLYGLRSATETGIGTYADLATALAGCAQAGAGFAGINPIHAGFEADPMAYSPYSPSSRRWLNVLHIDAGLGGQEGGDLIDYAALAQAHRAGLDALWAQGAPEGLDAWIAAQGAELHRFALHQALSEVLGSYWTDWPAAYRDPASPEVAAFAAANGDAIRFHAWLQWLAERQLDAVREAGEGMALGLYLDLAVGIHPAGADTWADPELYASGVSLGAPPDAFSREGQAWHLAPMRPDVLARRGFHPLAEVLRAQFRFARLLRIDHILGFERAFWVPDNGSGGAYVQMPKAALLAVARIEAARVGGTIVGEDLGNIPEGLHADLDRAGILGCRVAMFEQYWDPGRPKFKPAYSYDSLTLTSFATHDLPTWEGWKQGRDLDWRAELGSIGGEMLDQARHRRHEEREVLEEMLGGASVEAMHAHLAATPARLVAVQIEDILGLVEQPNLPGTVYDHPNWRRRLPLDVAHLGRLPALRRTAEIMARAGR